MTSPRFDVVGIGNAIVDVLAPASEDFLLSQGMQKGTMALLNAEQADSLYRAMGNGIETSGGSAANTIAAVAQLGARAGFIGRVRNDQLGEIFAHDLRATGARFDTPAAESGAATARCMILVTPDAQRTMGTFLGASIDLDPKDLDLSMVRETKVLYLEGYLWDAEAAKQAFLAAAAEVKAHGGEVALSLSDPFCVGRHQQSFLELVEGYVDILFANEAEITSLYNTDSFEVATDLVRGHCKIACLTRSSEGSLVLTGDTTFSIPPYHFGDLLDTTGAGDCYAAGFLYGYSQGWSYERCGHAGSICAGRVVTQMGPRSQVDLLGLIEANLIGID
ncbi:MAG: adenosine kinase [Synechococcaceae bacterium WB4_2_0805]|jgi:fructokinase|nr:adenosine kinase [Synechococcaceae bacterium WB4_2_0805]